MLIKIFDFSQKIFSGLPISETMRLRIFQKNNNTFLVGMMLSILMWHGWNKPQCRVPFIAITHKPSLRFDV